MLLFFSRFLNLFSGTPNGGRIGLSARSSSASQSGHGEILAKPNLKIYSFLDLNIATRGFSPDTILGEGGFGSVYKGRVDETTLADAQFRSGMNVAIKKLNPKSKKRLKEWKVI